MSKNKEIMKRAKFRSFYIDDLYYCESCGSHTHRCDSITGMCFECGADDWQPEPDKIGECI